MFLCGRSVNKIIHGIFGRFPKVVVLVHAQAVVHWVALVSGCAYGRANILGAPHCSGLSTDTGLSRFVLVVGESGAVG